MKHRVHDEVMRMQGFVKKHYWENIGVEEVAEYVGYSPRRCNLLFKICCGETLGAYLRILRMEDAKRLLESNIPVDRVALSLSYTPRGFRKAFREYFGVSPSDYVKTGKAYGRYSEIYEYRGEENWGKGKNPTPDGLWEFDYYLPEEKKYGRMVWSDSEEFRSPQWGIASSPQWYCCNRWSGYGMHPGRASESVKTFLCPRDGEVDVFFSVGRVFPFRVTYSPFWHSWETPCAARLYLNGVPLGDAAVMTSVDPVFMTATCRVKAGDRISLHIDPMGQHQCDGVNLYLQRVSYRNPDFESRK